MSVTKLVLALTAIGTVAAIVSAVYPILSGQL